MGSWCLRVLFLLCRCLLKLSARQGGLHGATVCDFYKSGILFPT